VEGAPAERAAQALEQVARARRAPVGQALPEGARMAVRAAQARQVRRARSRLDWRAVFDQSRRPDSLNSGQFE
jgi:hypothetical protein